MYYEMEYRVPYADTDQMGVVYYANYLEYFERSRTEMFRAIGMPYSLMEEKGIILPVSEAHCKYISSAKYDDLLTFRAYVDEYSRVKVKINAEIYRDKELLAQGYVVLACVNREFKITRLPEWMAEYCDKCLHPDKEHKKVKFIEYEKLYPIKFQPIYMERVWGGTMMSEVLDRKLPVHRDPIGESWELVDRDEVNSVVANGELAGATLNELLSVYGSYLVGDKAAGKKNFPLMVKLIDAGEKLSLQVHPDEQACRELGGGAEPKTEMWYVISSRPGAKIYAGLSPRATRVELVDMLDSPDVEKLMQTYSSQAGDAYYIYSGTLHAIGAGNLILEIQQNSDTTYRVNDWGRVGSDGKPRTLHKEQGLKSINFANRTSPRVPGAVDSQNYNRKLDVVTLCPFFKVYDLRLRSQWDDDTSDGESFHLLSAVKGKFRIGRDDRMTEIIPGETVLIPACFGLYSIIPVDTDDAIIIKTTL